MFSRAVMEVLFMTAIVSLPVATLVGVVTVLVTAATRRLAGGHEERGVPALEAHGGRRSA
jgi:hypothetical protein